MDSELFSHNLTRNKRAETMQALSELGVPVADYNLQEDLETIEQLR